MHDDKEQHNLLPRNFFFFLSREQEKRREFSCYIAAIVAFARLSIPLTLLARSLAPFHVEPNDPTTQNFLLLGSSALGPKLQQIALPPFFTATTHSSGGVSSSTSNANALFLRQGSREGEEPMTTVEIFLGNGVKSNYSSGRGKTCPTT